MEYFNGIEEKQKGGLECFLEVIEKILKNWNTKYVSQSFFFLSKYMSNKTEQHREKKKTRRKTEREKKGKRD